MRNSIKAIINKLEIVFEQIEEYKDTAEDAEYPNDERIEKLEEELSKIEEALDSLQDIE